jgi:hypothetical protein
MTYEPCPLHLNKKWSICQLYPDLGNSLMCLIICHDFAWDSEDLGTHFCAKGFYFNTKCFNLSFPIIMRWVANVACMKERCIQGFAEETWKEEPLGRPKIDGRTILKWVLKDCSWEGIGLLWLRIRTSGKLLWLDCSVWGYGQVASSCECNHEPLGSIKCREFLDWLKNC